MAGPARQTRTQRIGNALWNTARFGNTAHLTMRERNPLSVVPWTKRELRGLLAGETFPAPETSYSM
jgi:hypothetical protein